MLTRRNPQRSLSSILGVGKIQTNSENNTKNLHPTENHTQPNELDISLSSSNQSENGSGDRYSPSVSISSAKQSKAITFKNNSQVNHSIPSNKSERDDESAFSVSSHSSSIHEKNDKAITKPQNFVAKDIMVPTDKFPYKKVSKTPSPSHKDKIEKKSSNLSNERLLKKEKSRESFPTLSDKEHTKEHNVSPKLPIDKIKSFDKGESMPNAMEKPLDVLHSKMDIMGSEIRNLRSDLNDQLRHLNQKLDKLAAIGVKEIPELNNAQNLESNHERNVYPLDDSKNPIMTPEIKLHSNENPNFTNQNLIERMDNLERMFSAFCNMRKGSKKTKKSTSTDDTHSMGYHSSRRARKNETFARLPRRDTDDRQFMHRSSRGIGEEERRVYYNFTNLAPSGGCFLPAPSAFDDINLRLKTFQNRFTQEAEHLGNILDKAISTTHRNDLGSSAPLAPHWKFTEINDGVLPRRVPQLKIGPGNNLQVSHTTLTN